MKGMHRTPASSGAGPGRGTRFSWGGMKEIFLLKKKMNKCFFPGGKNEQNAYKMKLFYFGGTIVI